MWRPKQKSPCEASDVAMPQARLSREDNGKMPACFVETISREAKTTTIPSPNSGAVTPRANLVLMSEATDGVANTAPVPQGTRGVPSRQARTKAPSGANLLRSKMASKAPQCASLSGSSIAKFALHGGAKGLSLGVDSGVYAVSAPKGVPKVLSREARAKALSSANHLCGDEKNRASCYAQSNRASALSRLSPATSDLREFLTNKRKSDLLQTSSSCFQQVGCQLVTIHSVHCRLGPIPATPPNRRSVFDRLSEQAPVKHRKRSVSQDLPDPTSASVNMIGRGRAPHRGRRASHAANSPPSSSSDPDYSPG